MIFLLRGTRPPTFNAHGRRGGDGGRGCKQQIVTALYIIFYKLGIAYFPRLELRPVVRQEKLLN